MYGGLPFSESPISKKAQQTEVETEIGSSIHPQKKIRRGELQPLASSLLSAALGPISAHAFSYSFQRSTTKNLVDSVVVTVAVVSSCIN